MKNFAAIDFETANECRTSVCSVGVVIVRGGEIVDRFYSLIHPEPDYYRWFCMEVHGLCDDDTRNAPLFPEVWRQIEPLIGDLPLVAHNARFDEGCCVRCIAPTAWIIPNTSFTIRCRHRAKHSATRCRIISCRRWHWPPVTT